MILLKDNYLEKAYFMVEDQSDIHLYRADTSLYIFSFIYYL